MNTLRVTVFLLSCFLVIYSTGLVKAEHKDEISVHFEKSFEHEGRGDTTHALNEVEQILASEPNNYLATLRAGWLCYLKRRHKNSITYYRKAISLAPKAIEPNLGLMLPLMASRRWKDAEEVARKIIRDDPMNYYANSRLAFILFSEGKYDQALEQYDKVLKLFPADTEMQLGLGWTYYRKGHSHWKTAREWFAKVLSVKPTNSSARQGMNLITRGIQPSGRSKQTSAKSYRQCVCCWNPGEYMDSGWIAAELRYAKDQYRYRGLSPEACRAAGGTPCGDGPDCE